MRLADCKDIEVLTGIGSSLLWAGMDSLIASTLPHWISSPTAPLYVDPSA